MSAIPTFVLKKLYVARSLGNTSDGCQLQINNTLAPATITGVGPVTIDGTAHPQQDIVVGRGNERVAGADASTARPISFDINTVITIAVKGARLAAGENRVGLDVTTREAGRLMFEITDNVNA